MRCNAGECSAPYPQRGRSRGGHRSGHGPACRRRRQHTPTSPSPGICSGTSTQCHSCIRAPGTRCPGAWRLPLTAETPAWTRCPPLSSRMPCCCAPHSMRRTPPPACCPSSSGAPPVAPLPPTPWPPTQLNSYCAGICNNSAQLNRTPLPPPN